MSHPIHKVISVRVGDRYVLEVSFADGSTQSIDFEPVLRGQLYGPLRDPRVFEQVCVDPEVHTIVWPNGADFDPATLHDWPIYSDRLANLAASWDGPR